MLRRRRLIVRSSAASGAAFTLVELLVVIAITGVLVALLMPAIQASREAARRGSCVNKLKQQALTLQSFYAEQNVFPPGGRLHDEPFLTGVSWRVMVLPHAEEQALYERIAPTPDGGVTTWLPQSDMPTLFRCPSNPVEGGAPDNHDVPDYWGVAGASRAGEGVDLEDFMCGDLDANGFMYPGSRTRIAMIEDGTSNTLALGEAVYTYRAWMTGATFIGDPPQMICTEAANQIRFPINADNERWGYYVGDTQRPPDGEVTMLVNHLPFGSEHPGGANFAMADASVRFLPDEIDFTAFEDLATIAGGEVSRWPR